MYMAKEIYDCITKQIITATNKEISKCFSIDPSLISHLRMDKKHKIVIDRLCLLKDKERLIFTLVDINSKEEFECLKNKSIFIHLNIPYNDNEGKYVYEMKSGRQKLASIGGRIFCLKERSGEFSIKNIYRTKSSHLFSEEVKEFKDKVRGKRDIYQSLLKVIHYSLAKRKAIKRKRTMNLTGCSLDFLYLYIEKQFTEGMSWDNYGKYGWHIDHIIPCNTFNLFDEKEQERCFHYSNLRPLWASENQSRPKDGCDMFGYGLNI